MFRRFILLVILFLFYMVSFSQNFIIYSKYNGVVPNDSYTSKVNYIKSETKFEVFLSVNLVKIHKDSNVYKFKITEYDVDISNEEEISYYIKMEMDNEEYYLNFYYTKNKKEESLLNLIKVVYLDFEEVKYEQTLYSIDNFFK